MKSESYTHRHVRQPVKDREVNFLRRASDDITERRTETEHVRTGARSVGDEDDRRGESLDSADFRTFVLSALQLFSSDREGLEPISTSSYSYFYVYTSLCTLLVSTR